MTKSSYRYLFVFMLLFFMVSHVSAEKITIAVASNFALVFKSLISDFENLHEGSEVIMVSGSSGKIYAQIKHGAPFDIFMSADQEKPLMLVEEGLAFPESLFTFAIGNLVLWSATPELIDKDFSVLKNVNFNKLAIANSKLAPYGLAAEQVLAHLNLLETSRKKWVQGENIAQTYQFVESRNADLGFVAKSQVWREGVLKSGSAWFVPFEMYAPIKQDAVVLKATKNKQLAIEMVRFLQTPRVRAKIESYGYRSAKLDSDSTINGF